MTAGMNFFIRDTSGNFYLHYMSQCENSVEELSFELSCDIMGCIDAFMKGSDRRMPEETGNMDDKNNTGKTSVKAEIISWIKVIISAVIIALVVDIFIVANAAVPTGSMETTIPAGSRIMGLRLYYHFADPERGDIVIFKYPDDEKVDYLKRIIGLPVKQC